jgi:hypothetical protein
LEAKMNREKIELLVAHMLELLDALLEDDDAQSYSLAEVQTLLPSLSKIETAATMDELKEVFKAASAEATSEDQKMLVIASKNRRKEALRGSGE